MQFNNGFSAVATGNILCCSFVKWDTTGQFTVNQAGLGDSPIGIAFQGSLFAPNSINAQSFGASNTPNVAAVAGSQIMIYGPQDICWLQLGTGGGCTTGQYLKPDAQGLGVVASANDNVGAQANQNGNAGELITVVVVNRRV